MLTTPALVSLASLMLDFSRVERVTRHQDGKKIETNSDHTGMLAVIACTIAEAHPELGLDVGKVSQYVTVHDLPEVRTGDINTFGISSSPNKAAIRRYKAEREAFAVQDIIREHPQSAWLIRVLREYQEQAILEARFVCLVDKILPKYTHALNKGAALSKMEMLEPRDRVTMKRLKQDHLDQIHELNLKYPEFEVVIQYLREAMMLAESVAVLE